MWRLAPPKWPEEIFGKIDRVKAAQGKALFATHCASCHNSYPYTWTAPNKYGTRFLEVGLVPKTYMGTDMQQTVVVSEFMYTRQLSPYLAPPDKGKAVVLAADLKGPLVRQLLGRAVEKLHLTEAQMADLNGFREFPLPPGSQANWKAAPRDGVWATPPFLHNGSVPNLYEMLIPASKRTKKFYVGAISIRSKWKSTPAATPGPSFWILRWSATRTPAIRSRTVLAAMASSALC